ncbi:MAG: 6-bladed beta-propeller [Bacteroidales bacterium]|jgi:hypothetical protein
MTNKFDHWIFVSFVILIVILSCSTQPHDKIIEIDANKNYPVLDLKLSDIADITYVPLKLGKDPILLISGAPTRGVFVMSDRILVADNNQTDPKIVVYNFDGEPLYKIGEIGRGPGELSGFFHFTVDTIKREVYIWGTIERQLYVYNIEGQYIRSTKELNKVRFLNFENINDKTLVGFTPNAITYLPEWLSKRFGEKISNSGRSITYLDKENLSLIDIPDIGFKRIHIDKTGTGIAAITTTRNGSYLVTLRSDTTYFMDDSLRITPRFVDVTEYNNKGEICIFPVLETDKYVFLTTTIPIGGNYDHTSIKYLAYDKDQHKIFKIKNNSNKEDSGNPDAAFRDNIKILQYNKTLNSNYIVRSFGYKFLIENYKSLPDKLKQITDQMSEEDNPVLMLIKFK